MGVLQQLFKVPSHIDIATRNLSEARRALCLAKCEQANAIRKMKMAESEIEFQECCIKSLEKRIGELRTFCQEV